MNKKIITSPCIYCGCGCKLNYEVKDNKIVKILGDKNDDVSEGFPCLKGITINEVFDKNRITSPLINGKRVTLSKALDYIYKNVKEVSPLDVFFNTSGKITNENNFVIQKFARICLKTNNIDSCCTRLCHISTVMGMNNVFGTSNITRMSDVNDIDTLFIIGSEPERDYPIFFNKMMKNKKLKIIKVHSFIKSFNSKEKVINTYPGSESCLLNGIIHELIKRNVKSKDEGFNILKEKVKGYSKEFVCETSKISCEDYDFLINSIFESKKLGVFHGMALTQHVNSLENVHSLLNLVLLKKAKVLSLRGEINVQGVGDIGASPGMLPTGDYTTKKTLERYWGKICLSKGLNLLQAELISPVRVLFITEHNPFKSLPASKIVSKNLKKSFIIYFGSYNCEVSKKANVVIPIASLLESEGSITNGEKRLRKVNRVVSGGIELWQILAKLSKKFDKEKYFNYNSSKDILKEIKLIVKPYNKINVEELWKGKDAWADKDIKYKRFMPENFDGFDSVENKNFPFIFTTFRSKYSFLGNEVTKNSKILSKYREKVGFYMNEIDLKELNLLEGDTIKVSNSQGELISKVYISKFLPQKIIGAYIHYSNLKVNTLFPLNFDEESFTPNYKSVAVKIDKIKNS